MAMDTAPVINGDGWGTFKYGTIPIVQSGGRAHIPHVSTDAHDNIAPWSPDNPLFWFGAVLLATGLGMFAISGEIKVAKTKIAAGIGES